MSQLLQCYNLLCQLKDLEERETICITCFLVVDLIDQICFCCFFCPSFVHSSQSGQNSFFMFSQYLQRFGYSGKEGKN